VNDATGVPMHFLVNLAAGDILEFSHALGAGGTTGRVMAAGGVLRPAARRFELQSARVCAARQDTHWQAPGTSAFSQSPLWEGQRHMATRVTFCSTVRIRSTSRMHVATSRHILLGGFYYHGHTTR
jgi:hypothetical protein